MIEQIYLQLRWMVIGGQYVKYWVVYASWAAAVLGGAALGASLHHLRRVLREKYK